MKHKDKLKLARRIMTKEERKNHAPPFQSLAWEKRKDDIATRTRNREITAGYRKAKKHDRLK